MATVATDRSNYESRGPYRALIAIGGLAILLFLAAPWSFPHKVHAALHGLCAQRPSHTYSFGGTLLPYDARMNGIYLGALITLIVLVANGAHRNALAPTWSRVIVLGVFGGVMVADGLNSFLEDMQLPHPYKTQNWMRLITGMLAGITLGVALTFLMGTTLWRRPSLTEQTLADWRWLAPIGVVLAGAALLVWSGWDWLYYPLAMVLIVATVLTLSMLGLVLITILRRRDFTFESFESLGSTATWAVVFAGLAMALLAIGRTLLESSVGGPPPV
jgi:uncharacterized membrane protein